MGAFSIWHILLVLVVILLVFGAGKLPRLMGDFAHGIKAFKKGMKEPTDEERTAAAERLQEPAAGQPLPRDADKSTTEKA
jgi:sec-independent protein translocase protein TatA